MLGQTISHYKILEKLGEGGMGVVYKAEDTKLKREVAIKFLPRQIAASEEERQRFKIEARAAAALNHPNIATIHAIEEVDEELFIVMEFIEGQELKSIIDDRLLSIDDVINYAKQIAEGLQAAHEKGVTHRDIKSANIMVTEKDHVKIMDFGLAKVRGGAQVTKIGTTLGTVAYMSPEQALGEEADCRSDIWSSGVVLYEMLTGKLPFGGDYEQAVTYAILNEEPQRISELRADVPTELQQIVEKALAKRPDDRYQNAQAFLRHIEALTGLKTPTGAQTKSLLTKKWSILVAAITTMALLAMVTLFLFRDVPPDAVDRKSVAVLPFVNMSADPENEYFADGLSEEILNSLNALPNLLVTARTSSFFYKDKDVPVDEIAERLGVAHVLEGSVRRSGDRLRVTAQLVRASDGFHLWSNTYDAQLEDVFQIQTDVAEKVAGALSIYLDDEQREALAASGTRNVEAFQAFLKGRELMDQAHAGEPGVSLWDANEEFERAMALDPTYAAPAMSHYDAFAHYLMDGPDSPFLKEPPGRGPTSEEEALERLFADLDRAVNNAPTPTVRIVAELNREFFSRSWNRMPGLLERLREEGAIEEASDFEGWLYHILLLNGEFEMARRLSDHKIKTDPLNAMIWSLRARLFLALGEFDAAEDAIERGRALAGDHPFLDLDELWLAVARHDKDAVLALLRRQAPQESVWRAAYLAAVEGDYEHATALAEQIDAAASWPRAVLLMVYNETGDKARARALVKRIDDLAAGPAIFVRPIPIRHNFDPADAPNFSARLEEAGIDPANFRPIPRLSVEAGAGEGAE